MVKYKKFLIGMWSVKRVLTVLFAGALTLLTPLASLAETVDFAGAQIQYTNAEVSYAEGTGDLILTFKNTQSAGSFTILVSPLTGRYLVVGGGGAGGTPISTLKNYGQGGGGGAGGFIAVEDYSFNTGDYSVTVGAGGAAATSNTAASNGANGSNSILTYTSMSSEIANASGGGGGGARKAGSSGGSGGGGSPSGTSSFNIGAKNGGAGVSGQGKNGGKGSTLKYGGGGGGAGGVGGTGTNSKGGDGLENDISGMPRYYAAGGGGGRSANDSVAAGGSGIGGTGAGQTTEPTAGVDGTGSGGGGGSSEGGVGGKGGDGIVIVRFYMPAIPPTVKTGLKYTGENQVGIENLGSNWELVSGSTNGTNATTYPFTIKPKTGLKWNDNSGEEERELSWSIASSTVPAEEEPKAVSGLVYNGTEQDGVSPSFSSYYTLSNEKKTKAGQYTATATLNNPAGYENCTWADGTTTSRTINYEISVLTLTRPTAKTPLHFNGSEQVGIEDSSSKDYYSLGETNKATAVGNYTAKAIILEQHRGSCKWEGESSETVYEIDIPWSISGKLVEKPNIITSLIYNGENQVGVIPSVDSANYTLTGVANATNAGEYVAYATLKEPANYDWNGEAPGTDEIEIRWRIASKKVPIPTLEATSFVYDGTEKKVKIVTPDFEDYCSISGKTNETSAGEYTLYANLKNPDDTTKNFVWENETSAPQSINWVIEKAKVAPPSAIEGLKFNNTLLQGIKDSVDASKYQLISGLKNHSQAGEHTAIFNLKDSNNYTWQDGTTNNITISWNIAKADNAITSLKIGSWKVEENPVVHPVRAEATWAGANEPKIEYAQSEAGPWTETQPTNAGVHFVRATVNESGNWHAAQKIIKFSIWTDPTKIFRDYVDIRVQGYTGTEALTNFPLLVRISEKRMRGFYYERAGLDGQLLTFVDESESSLPYEVDKWDVNGESAVWVRLNTLTNNATIRMYWCVKEGALPPGYTPEEVWADYAGVWHFSETITGSESEAVPSTDATGNSNFAWPVNYNAGSSIARMRSSAGLLGNARQIETGQAIGGGCHLVVSNSASLNFGGKFTVSGWMKLENYPSTTAIGKGKVWPFAAREGETAAETGYGAFIARSSNANSDLRSIMIYGAGSSGGAAPISTQSMFNRWVYFGVSYHGNWIYAGGSEQNGNTFHGNSIFSVTEVTDYSSDLAFGNIPGTNTTYASFCGKIDEYRLAKLPRSEEWLKAEYKTIDDELFCTNSLVVKDGLKVNYWLKYPAFAPIALEVGDKPTVVFNGVLAEGWASTNFVNIYNSTTNNLFPTDAGSYRVIFSLDESFTGYDLLEKEKGFFNLTINGKSPYNAVQGNLGDSGRVLLMNRDSGPKGTTGLGIRYQGYCFNLTDRPQSENDAPTYWEIITSEDANLYGCPNLKSATESILWTSGKKQKLWHLVNCRHGNTINEVQGAFAPVQTQNYLPWSATSYGIVSDELLKAKPAGVGQIVMRNIQDAAVYSSCFTNGIGAIYFDAVNGWNNNIGGNYTICVEICTNVLGDATHLIPPTDENITEYNIETNGATSVVTTNVNFYAKAVWKPVALLPFINDNTPGFNKLNSITNLNLAVQNGGTTTNFYRIVANVNSRIPARFRIRRVSTVGNAGLDGTAFILLDNIIVSYPAMSADLSPVGEYDTTLGGKHILGVENAFTVPFPAATDSSVRARAKAKYYLNEGVASADTNNFIVAANLHYRWRYLRQRAQPACDAKFLDPVTQGYYGDSNWHIVPLNPKDGFLSVDALNIPAAVGDVEFWYDLTMNTPYYEYVDYSGLDIKIPFTERCTAVTNHINSAERDNSTYLPTTGVDWFVRLREGKSNYQSMQVVVEGAISEVCEMDVIEDNMWRALIKVPTNITGTVSMYFQGKNLQTPGSTKISYNNTYWGPTASADETGSKISLPANGSIVEYDSPSEVKRLSVALDHCTGYIEVKLSDRFLTWGLSRAEYQNFNNWSDAWSPKSSAKFRVVAGTNGVDDVAMKIHNLNTGNWELYNSNVTNWNETFYLVNYADTSYPKETYFQDYRTPANWNAHDFTYVSRNLNKFVDTSKGADTVSGIAAKLRGQGAGYIEFGLTDRPPGLEKVEVEARVGQSVDFGSMTYNARSLFDDSWNPRKNYLFFSPVLMSSKVNTATALGDMAVGASVSVVAYYWPGVGCYEYRISRQSNNANNNGYRYVAEIIKWHNINGKIEPTVLATRNCDSRQLWNNDNSITATSVSPEKYSKENPRFYGMFISVENTPSGTLVIGGASQDCQTPITETGFQTNWNAIVNRTTGGLQNGYCGLAYRDNTNPHTYGGYGVAAKDCLAKFSAMHHYNTPIPSGNIKYESQNNSVPPEAGKSKYFQSGNNTSVQNPRLRISESEPIFDVDDISSGRWGYQSRLGVYTNTWLSGDAKLRSVGLYMPSGLKQDVILQLQSATGGEWVEYGRKTISDYNYTALTFPLHIIGNWRLRVTTGTDNVDAVISSIRQYRWEAPNHEDLTYGDDMFVYTQGLAVTNTARGGVDLVLQPSRGDVDKAMSLRSPMLRGLGKVSFSYKAADPNAEVWVQIATNDVIDNIVELNTSVKESPQYWQTVAKYAVQSKPGYDGKLVQGPASTVSCYVGLHNRADRPVRGVFRLFIPPEVVETARSRAFKTDDVSYGKITLTDMTVSDEPGLSERSWRGWNMRTIGDSSDEEQRMYLPDTKLSGEAGSGLVAALNNSTDDTDDITEKTQSEFPTIFSPTFQITKGRKSGVGSVDFRARLYSTTGKATEKNGGKIWLYGAASSIDGPWTLLGEYAIDSSVFKTYTWQTGKENYLAVKFVVADPSAKTSEPLYDRIILDEITVREKVEPSVGFAYARPFRMNLFDKVEIADILSPAEQPLCGESWGVQTQVRIKQLADEIDIENGFRVFLSYYRGEKWGYEKWKGEPSAVRNIELFPVGEKTNLVFRSVGINETTLVPPTDKAGEIVQFQLVVKYKDRGGIEYDQPIETYNDWTQPSWYYPIDKNVENGGVSDPERFSPYTILDTVSPGRAWINEVNFNDGTPAYNGGEKIVNNQFIEICVPSGVDMAGWKLRLTDLNYKTWIMAKFGDNGIPASKVSSNSKNGYEFFLLESPETNLAGGINRGNSLLPVADGTWNNDGKPANASQGRLDYSLPYQFELIRPSGIIEHQFVVEGTNTVANKSYGYLYSGTNLVEQLAYDESPFSPKRFFAGRDVERAVTQPAEFGSSGVVGGESNGDPAPGDKETWEHGLRFTAGALNENQVIPSDWYLPPNGTNSWVYLFNEAPHIMQSVGTNISRNIVMVVPVGTETNVSYSVGNWYAMAIEQDGSRVKEGIRGDYVYAFTPTNNKTQIFAKESPSPDLITKYKLDNSNPYSPSVLKWLETKWPGHDSDDIRLAIFRDIANTTNIVLSLTEMYWLDIPAVPETPEEASSVSGGTNWWLRAGITSFGRDHLIYRQRGGREVCFTNKLVDMQMYISNSVTHTVYAPQRLQGLDNARSDNFSGAWTSATFKVRLKLNLAWETDFFPFRFFTFDSGSFTGKEGAESNNTTQRIGPYSARIEILDPHSPESIGVNYGWPDHPSASGFSRWSLDTDIYPFGVEKLKYDDTYPERLP